MSLSPSIYGFFIQIPELFERAKNEKNENFAFSIWYTKRQNPFTKLKHNKGQMKLSKFQAMRLLQQTIQELIKCRNRSLPVRLFSALRTISFLNFAYLYKSLISTDFERSLSHRIYYFSS